MGIQTSKYQYIPKRWDDAMIALEERADDLKISVIGGPSTGKTKFCNKANAILRDLKAKIHIREVHNESLDESDGIIIVGSVKNLAGIDDTYAKLNGKYNQMRILVFITHTDQATRDEIYAVEELIRQRIHKCRIFYAPVCDPFSADSINDSDLTLLLSIKKVSDWAAYTYSSKLKVPNVPNL